MPKRRMPPLIISADEIKKTLPGYHPERSEEFHRESTRQADKAYEQALLQPEYSTVILLSGGSASGKTEYLSAYLAHEHAIIVDGTLSTVHGFEIKLQKALKSHRSIEVHAVIPDSLSRAFVAFLHRDRKYSDDHFYRTHAQSRATLLAIAMNHPEIEIRVIESHIGTDDTLSFTQLQSKSRAGLIEYLQTIQYTEQEVIREVS